MKPPFEEDKIDGPEKSVFGSPTQSFGTRAVATRPKSQLPAVRPIAKLKPVPVRRPAPRKTFFANLLSAIFLLVGLAAIITAIYYIRSRVGGMEASRSVAPKVIVAEQNRIVPTIAHNMGKTVAPIATRPPPDTQTPVPATVVPATIAPIVVEAEATPEPNQGNVTLPNIDFVAKPAPNASVSAPNPLFGPNYDPADGKPVFVCVADPFISHLTLLQMQVAGKDIAHGFHLGIVPLGLNASYALDEATYNQKVIDGEWDCVLDRVDENAELNIGPITAIIDESAGANGIWGRGMTSYEQLAGKRVGYVNDSSSKYFMLHALFLLPTEARKTIVTTGYRTVDEAIAAFNNNELDAVSAWQPLLAETAKNGGQPILNTDQLRVVVDAIITSRKAVQTRPQVVQAFHDAWFETLKEQTDNMPLAAHQINAWGHHDWTKMPKDNVLAGMTEQLKWVAIADLSDNLAIMGRPTPLLRMMNTVRDVRVAGGETVSSAPLDQLTDARFVQALQARSDLRASRDPLNNSFSLVATSDGEAPAATPVAAGVAITTAESGTVIPSTVVTTTAGLTPSTTASTTLGVLPCRKFAFLPDSAALTAESQRVLDVCVLPVMQQRAGIYLHVKGSAAWPGPTGTYSQTQIIEIATARARAIIEYLVSKGIERTRFSVEGVLPPQDHWETTDGVKQSEDRYVEMTLVTSGR